MSPSSLAGRLPTCKVWLNSRSKVGSCSSLGKIYSGKGLIVFRAKGELHQSGRRAATGNVKARWNHESKGEILQAGREAAGRQMSVEVAIKVEFS